MAAASDKDLTSCVELQQNLKGVKVGLPNLSTLAQKGNEQVSLFSLICSFSDRPSSDGLADLTGMSCQDYSTSD